MPKVTRARFKPRDPKASAHSNARGIFPSRYPFFSLCRVGVRAQKRDSRVLSSSAWGGRGSSTRGPRTTFPLQSQTEDLGWGSESRSGVVVVVGTNLAPQGAAETAGWPGITALDSPAWPRAFRFRERPPRQRALSRQLSLLSADGAQGRNTPSSTTSAPGDSKCFYLLGPLSEPPWAWPVLGRGTSLPCWGKAQLCLSLRTSHPGCLGCIRTQVSPLLLLLLLLFFAVVAVNGGTGD